MLMIPRLNVLYGGMIVPKANVVISCRFSQGVNVNQVAQAISDIVKSMTGSNVQVIANEQQTKLSPVDIHIARNKGRGIDIR